MRRDDNILCRESQLGKEQTRLFSAQNWTTKISIQSFLPTFFFISSIQNLLLTFSNNYRKQRIDTLKNRPKILRTLYISIRFF